MNKNIRNAVIVVAVAALAFTLMSFSKKKMTAKTELSVEEKNNLFSTAKGQPAGGAAPPNLGEEFMAQQQAERKRIHDEAMQKIKEYGLEAEYEAYLKAHENDPLPQ